MSAMVAVFTREMRERSRVLLIAAAIAVIPFLVAYLPGSNADRPTLLAIAGGSIAMTYAFAVAVLLGASVLSRDLAQKRLSFYFSRPIPPAALWSGKAVASLLVVFAALLIIGVPAFLASREGWWSAWHTQGAPVPEVVAFACVALFVVSHAAATMLRSRSALLAVDFLCAAGASAAGYVMVRSLIRAGGVQAIDVLSFLAPAMVLILAIAPVWQLARGRTDARRSHASLSLFVWSAMGVFLLVAGSYVLWVVRAPLSTIDQSVVVEQNPSGEWAFVAGQSTRGSELAGFVNTRTGETRRTHTGLHWAFEVSRDGSTLAMLTNEIVRNRTQFGLEIHPFGGAGDVMRIPFGGEGFVSFALTDDGSRLAVATHEDVRVYDTHSGAILAATRMDGQKVARLYFASPSVVRIHGDGAIRELDVAHKAVTQTGVDAADAKWMTISGDATRAYLPQPSRIIDARTGATIADLPAHPFEIYAAAMMNDGRVAVVEGRGLEQKTLRVFDRDGRELRSIALPVLGRSAVRAQLGDRKIIVGGSAGSMLVDVDRGTVGPLAKDTRGPLIWGRDVRMPRLAENAQIVAGDSKAKQLVMWDPRTGATKPLFR